jgi:hypothetical protein
MKTGLSNRKLWWLVFVRISVAHHRINFKLVPNLRCQAIGRVGFVPCHGSTLILAGRVCTKPAPDNLEVPPHMYLSDTRLLIGEDTKKA